MTRTTCLLNNCVLIAAFLASATASRGCPQDDDSARLLEDGNQARKCGDYAEAEGLLLEAVKGAEVFGPMDLRLASALADLGKVYSDLEQHGTAELLHRRSLLIQENAWGPGHLETARQLHRIAYACERQGDFKVAESLYQQSIVVGEANARMDETVLAASLNNLSSRYVLQGRFADAKPLLSRLLEIYEKMPDHDEEIAPIADELAWICFNDGEYARAGQLYTRVLSIDDHSRGPNSPESLEALKSLAGVYHAQHDYESVSATCTRILNILTSKYDPDDEQRLIGINEYSSLLGNAKFLAGIGPFP